MKKFICVLFSLFVSLSSFALVGNSNISANALDVSVSDIFPGMSVSFKSEGGVVHNSPIGYIYAGDKLTYCVEPLKVISTGNSVVPSSMLTPEVREKLSIVSYNGYNGTDRNDYKWYAATQIYIWESLGNVFSVNGFNEYSTYKNQIINRINEYDKLPSFTNAKITLEKDEEKVLEDSNKVFSTFPNIIHNGKANFSREINKLKLLSTSNAYQEGKIAYQKFREEEIGLPIVYQGANDKSIQSIFYPKISKNPKGELSYRVQPYGKVRFTKRAEVLNSVLIENSEFGIVYNPQFSESGFKEVEAKIYAREDIIDVWGNKVANKNDLVDTIISKDEATLSKKLLAGKYYLKEFKTKEGYVLDQKEYDFAIVKDNEEIDIKDIILNNERSRVEIDFTKLFEEGSLLPLEDAYKDVVVGIYTKEDIVSYSGEVIVNKDNLVYLSTIDSNGKLIKKVDLPLGKYYLKELKTNGHFVLDENKYDFDVLPNGEKIMKIAINQNGKVMNYLHRNKLAIYKIDGKSKKPIQATFVLYDQNMKEIQEFTTDENGQYVFEGVVDGFYYIQEIEAPEGYKLNPKLIKVELNNDVMITLKNNKAPVINPSVETNDTSNHKTLEMSMLSSMVVMYGFILSKIRKC